MSADQIDVLCHLAVQQIRREADALWLQAAMWEPAPCPPRNGGDDD